MGSSSRTPRGRAALPPEATRRGEPPIDPRRDTGLIRRCHPSQEPEEVRLGPSPENRRVETECPTARSTQGPRTRGSRRARAAVAWLFLSIAGALPASPGAAAQADGTGGPPYRLARFAASETTPAVPAPGDAFAVAVPGGVPRTVDPVRLPPGWLETLQESDEVDTSRVAMGTILAGVGGWFLVAYAVSEATNSFDGLYYAAPVSIVASALTAHGLSEGHGGIALSLGVSAALSALLAAGFDEFWTIVGPGVAIPISISVETP